MPYHCKITFFLYLKQRLSDIYLATIRNKPYCFEWLRISNAWE